MTRRRTKLRIRWVQLTWRGIRRAGRWVRAFGGVPSGVVLVVLLILLLQPALPNLLGLRDPTLANTQLTAIAGILASILGIVVAVLLVALDLLRRTYSHYGLLSIFRNRHLIMLIVLYSTTAVVALFVAGRLSNPLTTADIALCHLVFALFVIAIGMLFPSCRAIMGEAHSQKRVATLISAIDIKPIPTQNRDAVQEFGQSRGSIATDPIYVLAQAVGRFIQDDDSASAHALINGVTDRLDELLRSTGERRRTIAAVLPIYRMATRKAIEQQDEGTLLLILECLAQIHRVCAHNGFRWDQMIELNDVLRAILQDCASTGPTNASQSGLWWVLRIMFEHLRANCPSEDHVSYLRQGGPTFSQREVDDTRQWDHVAHGYARMVTQVVDTAIRQRRVEAVITGIQVLLEMASSASDLANLGTWQKEEIVRRAWYRTRELIIRSIHEGLVARIGTELPLVSFSINEMLEKGQPYASTALVELGQLLIDAAGHNALTPSILNDVGFIARGAATRAKNSSTNRDAVRFCVDVFDKIRGLYEQRPIEQNCPEYLECYSQVASINLWLARHNSDERALVEYCSSVQGRFACLADARRHWGQARVKWPDLDIAEH